MTLSAGRVRDFAIDPPSPPNPERVPLTDAHRRGVSDPMSAALMRVSGTGDPMAPGGVRPQALDFRRPHAL